MVKKLMVMTFAAAVFAVPSVLKAADSSIGSVTASTPSVRIGDKQAALAALTSIHHDNLMEIEMGKLASGQGQSEGVRQFGDRLVKDHQAAEDKVQDLAKQLEVKLPDMKPMTAKDQAKMDKLKALKGASFDQAFAKAMVEDHRKAINNLKTEQPKLQGSSAGDLVAEVLPVVEEHERIAKQLIASPKSNQPS